MSAPIRVHPDNPKLFEYDGRPLVLLTATEHYGAVFNGPFRFDRYLADARETDAPGADGIIDGELAVDVPAGEYEAACFAPATGLYSPWSIWRGGPDTRFALPSFASDIVLHLRRRS